VPDRAYLLSLEQIGIKLGLDQIRALLDRLGRPDRAFPSIVVAGTNGKGSVTAMVERGLRAAGYRTGRYTSPHLVHLEERFVIDGAPITPPVFDALAARIRHAAESLAAPPSFFEATTALALDAFRDAGVDVAVLEVGLGGRLDATNAVESRAVAITAIDLDHEAYLGDTIDAIAHEKAGIIKRDGLTVLADNPPIVREIVRGVCAHAGASFVFAPDGVTCDAAMAAGRLVATVRTPHAEYPHLALALRGRHQIGNAVAAIRLLEELNARGLWRVPADAIRQAVEHVDWPGRLELRTWRRHPVLIDGAHNPSGAQALADYVREVYRRRIPFVVGVMQDKNIRALLHALGSAASHFVCTAPSSPRAALPASIAATAALAAPGVETFIEPVPLDALARAADLGSPVVVAGSLFLAGEIRANLS
jgi:dihydrofolate synthase/folylpolyglutamate synthase